MVVADGLELIVLMTILIALSAISYYVLFHPLNRVRVRSHKIVALLTLIFFNHERIYATLATGETIRES